VRTQKRQNLTFSHHFGFWEDMMVFHTVCSQRLQKSLKKSNYTVHLLCIQIKVKRVESQMAIWKQMIGGQHAKDTSQQMQVNQQHLDTMLIFKSLNWKMQVNGNKS